MFLLSRLSLSRGITSLTSQLGHHVSHFPAGASRLSLPSWGITSPTSQLGHHVSHFPAGASRISLPQLGNHVSHFPAGASCLSLSSWGLGNHVYHFPGGELYLSLPRWDITDSRLLRLSWGITTLPLQCGHLTSHFTMGHHTTHPGASRLSLHRTGIASLTSR